MKGLIYEEGHVMSSKNDQFCNSPLFISKVQKYTYCLKHQNPKTRSKFQGSSS